MFSKNDGSSVIGVAIVALLTLDTSANGLFQPLPLVFEPLEYPGAVDVQPELVAVSGVTFDLDFRTADINIPAYVGVV